MNEIKTFMCSKCGYVFETNEYEHGTSITTAISLCPKCQYMCCEIKFYYESIEPIEVYTCDICQEKFDKYKGCDFKEVMGLKSVQLCLKCNELALRFCVAFNIDIAQNWKPSDMSVQDWQTARELMGGEE